jgi:hypothetical protein
MHTPTRKSSQYGRRGGNSIENVLCPSSINNERAPLEQIPPYKLSSNNENKDNYTYNINNSSRGNSAFNLKQNRIPSRGTSRAASRNTSRSYIQQPHGVSGVNTSTPYGKSSSRSTSRSSSRLSLSSMASTPVSFSRTPSSSIYTADSVVSLNTLGIGSSTNNSKIQVTLRPRPLDYNSDSIENSPWNIDLANSQIEHADIGSFQYDHVFSTSDSNENVFEIVAAPILEKCLNGYNGTIFAYGMTGSGKTYSMRGVLKNSIEMLFKNSINEYDEMLQNSNGDAMDQCVKNWDNDGIFQDETILVNANYRMKYITCSILEIYNEKIKDLLNIENINQNESYRGSNVSNDLRIVEDDKFGIRVRGLKEIKVTSSNQLFELIDQGESLRCTDSTDYNYTSSRSHFLVMMKVFMENSEGHEIVSVLNFCDLAGSERATSHIDRRKEGGYINKSLLALGTVITKLSENNGNSNAHIPYRDSKLTRLLQPSLSGGSMVSILCTIQLGTAVVGETTNTLRFGCRAKNILLNVKKNTEDLDINKIINENEALKLEILELRNIISNKDVMNIDNKEIIKDDLYFELVAENNILNEQVEHLKRLQLEHNIIRSQECENDLNSLTFLLNDLILDSQTRKRFDDIVKRIGSGLHEYDNRFNEIESYVGHLENRIRVSEIELARHTQQEPSNVLNTVASMSDTVMKNGRTFQDELIEELQEEITELQSRMHRKDAMIRALQLAGNSS